MTRKWFDEEGNRLPCLMDDCEEPIRSNGLCEKHYQNFYYMSARGIGRKRYNTGGK